MFNELILTVEENGKGTHVYVKAADLACARAVENSDTAAAWFLLASIAQRIVEQNDRIAVTTVESQQWFDGFRTEIDRLNAAFTGADLAARLQALNLTAKQLVDPAT